MRPGRSSFVGGFLGSALQGVITRVTAKTIGPLLFSLTVGAALVVRWWQAQPLWMKALIVVAVGLLVVRPWRWQRPAGAVAAVVRPVREPIPAWLRQEIIDRDRSICGICGFRVTDLASLHIDHINPVHNGGTNDPDNLQVAHDDCNLRKGGTVGWVSPWKGTAA